MSKTSTSELLQRIIRCPNILASRSNSTHPCRRIVASQDDPGEPFQFPEPWCGFLETAPILFIGSNPSISYSEAYPVDSPAWPPEKVASYFTHKFHDGWVKDGRYARLRNPEQSEYSKYPTKYWSSVRQRAKELLERELVCGEDYCLTEVVHCKSTRQVGVKEAAAECTRLYLRRVLEAAGAKVVIVMGAFAASSVRSEVRLLGTGRVQNAVPEEALQPLFAYVPHPAAFGPKDFRQLLGEEGLELLRDKLRR